MAETEAEKLRRRLGLPPKPQRRSVRMGGPGLEPIEDPGSISPLRARIAGEGLPAYSGVYQGPQAVGGFFPVSAEERRRRIGRASGRIPREGLDRTLPLSVQPAVPAPQAAAFTAPGARGPGGQAAAQPGAPAAADALAQFDAMLPAQQQEAINLALQDPVIGPEIQAELQQIVAADRALATIPEEGGSVADVQTAATLVGHKEARQRRVNQIAADYMNRGIGVGAARAQLEAKQRAGQTWVDPNTGATLGLDRNGTVRQVSPPPFDLVKITDTAIKNVTARHLNEQKEAAFSAKEGESVPLKPTTAEEITNEVALIVAGIRAAQQALGGGPAAQAVQPGGPTGSPPAPSAAAPPDPEFQKWLTENYPDAVGVDLGQAGDRAIRQQFERSQAVNREDIATELEANGLPSDDAAVDEFLASPMGKAWLAGQK